jgi:hypothetical protein
MYFSYLVLLSNKLYQIYTKILIMVENKCNKLCHIVGSQLKNMSLKKSIIHFKLFINAKIKMLLKTISKRKIKLSILLHLLAYLKK